MTLSFKYSPVKVKDVNSKSDDFDRDLNRNFMALASHLNEVSAEFSNSESVTERRFKEIFKALKIADPADTP